jgi:hypothetical protein
MMTRIEARINLAPNRPDANPHRAGVDPEWAARLRLAESRLWPKRPINLFRWFVTRVEFAIMASARVLLFSHFQHNRHTSETLIPQSGQSGRSGGKRASGFGTRRWIGAEFPSRPIAEIINEL